MDYLAQRCALCKMKTPLSRLDNELGRQGSTGRTSKTFLGCSRSLPAQRKVQSASQIPNMPLQMDPRQWPDLALTILPIIQPVRSSSYPSSPGAKNCTVKGMRSCCKSTNQKMVCKGTRHLMSGPHLTLGIDRVKVRKRGQSGYDPALKPATGQ